MGLGKWLFWSIHVKFRGCIYTSKLVVSSHCSSWMHPESWLTRQQNQMNKCDKMLVWHSYESDEKYAMLLFAQNIRLTPIPLRLIGFPRRIHVVITWRNSSDPRNRIHDPPPTSLVGCRSSLKCLCSVYEPWVSLGTTTRRRRQMDAPKNSPMEKSQVFSSAKFAELLSLSLSLLLFKSLAENEHNLRQKIRSFQWATEVNRLKSWIFVSADCFWSGDGDGNTKKNKVYAKHFMWLLSFISELRTGILFIQKMLNLPILRLH